MEENESIDKSTSISLVNLGKLKILTTLYTDLAQPSVQKVGKALGNVFGLTQALTFPFWYANEFTQYKQEIIKRNFEKVKEKLDEIPEEKVCEVPPEIGVPIVEKLTYVTNEHIRNAYLNLLQKASSSDTSMLAHPSFVGIIEKLSTDEAKIIAYLKNKDFVPYIQYKVYHLNPLDFNAAPQRFHSAIELNVKLDYPDNLNIYIDHLMSLGILINMLGRTKKPAIYRPLEDLYEGFRKEFLIELDKNLEFTDEEERKRYHETSLYVERSFFDITSFGILFIDACTDQETPKP